ncbi:MAG: hypothetical protein WDO69_13175 [Pseudomonadota bacterium]
MNVSWGALCCFALLYACSQAGPATVASADSGPSGSCPVAPKADSGSISPNDGGSFNECVVGLSEPATRFVKADGSCSFQTGLTQLPANVLLIIAAYHTSGTSDPLACNSTCSGGGWNFKSLTDPGEVQICQSTCDALRRDPTTQLEFDGICPSTN